jgi:hypothetical protein
VRILAVLVLFVGIAVQCVAISQSPIEFYAVFYRPHPDGDEVAPPEYAVIAAEEGEPSPDGNDSVWQRRWSAWDGYGRLWRSGVHDLFWLRWWQWRSAQSAEEPRE